MSFFQNPFSSEFRGSWVLGDRQHCPTFIVKPHAGRGPEIVTSGSKDIIFDLSGNDGDGSDGVNLKKSLTITFAIDNVGFKNWTDFTIDIGGATVAKTTSDEIITALNADANFSSWFTADIGSLINQTNHDRIYIRQKQQSSRLKFFIRNTGAETVLQFNALAGVAEMPTYFARHTVGDTYRWDFTDAQNSLVLLDPDNSAVDAAVIDNAKDAYGRSLGYASGTIRADYELLEGKSGLFMFSKINIDNGNISTIIEYPAGAKVGDLAKLTTYQYSGNQPSQITEEPYTLTDSDLITPAPAV